MASSGVARCTGHNLPLVRVRPDVTAEISDRRQVSVFLTLASAGANSNRGTFDSEIIETRLEPSPGDGIPSQTQGD